MEHLETFKRFEVHRINLVRVNNKSVTIQIQLHGQTVELFATKKVANMLINGHEDLIFGIVVTEDNHNKPVKWLATLSRFA